MRKPVIAILSTLVAALALAGTALAADKAPETIMRANCGTCHGQLGEGGGPSWVDPSQTAMRIQGSSTTRIKNWVRAGRPPEMPAFPAQEINNTELNNLAMYIHMLPGSYIPEPTNYAATVTITDEDPWYNPMQVQITAGQMVKFVNVGKTYHPVTQIEFVTSRGAQGTDSGLMGPNGVYYRTFDTAGKYTFLCKIHPYMRGEVYVDQAPTAPTYHVDAPLAPPTTPGTGEVWVEAQFQDYPGKAKDGVIQVIDPSNWTVKNMIPVGNNPHNIWFTKGSTEAVVTNWFDNTITRINAGTKAVIGDVITGATNAHVTSDYTGSNMYVTIEGSHYIQPVDTRRWSLGAPIWTSGYGPHGIWYGNGKILTANTMDNTATIYDAGTASELATVPAGLYPLGAGTNTTGTKGYIGNCLDGTVSVIDMVNKTKTKDIYIGGCPVQAPVSPDNRYVVVPNSPYVTIIDTATDAVVAQYTVGKGAHGAAFGPKQGGGTYAYVTHKYENYITVVDMDTLTIAGQVPLQTTTTGKVAIVGAVDTGGNGIAVNPNPAPWQ